MNEKDYSYLENEDYEANDDFILYECENLDNEAKLILEARRR